MNKWIELAFKNSTALTLLVLSVILVFFAISPNIEHYSTVAFFTFLYAFISYKIRVLTKKEGWGEYAVGKNLGAFLYFAVDTSLLIAWASGLISILIYENLAFYELFNYGEQFIKVMHISLTTFSIFFLVWVFYIAYRKWKKK